MQPENVREVIFPFEMNWIASLFWALLLVQLRDMDFHFILAMRLEFFDVIRLRRGVRTSI